MNPMKTLSNKRPRNISLNNIGIVEHRNKEQEICLIFNYRKKRNQEVGVYKMLNSKGVIVTTNYFLGPSVIKLF